MFDELWSEIQDMPGEIFDLPEMDDALYPDSFYPITEEEMNDVYDDYIGTFWEADDGDDLVEEITSASGWCIKSIDYRHILN
jgi:hypothetical protein